jgi:hypothetical protein
MGRFWIFRGPCPFRRAPFQLRPRRPVAPPVATAVSPGMRANGGSARRPGHGPALVHREGHGRPPILLDAPPNQASRPYGPLVRGVGRADGCVGFSLWPREIALWRNAWALCGGADLAGGPFGQVPRPGGGPVWPSAQTTPPGFRPQQSPSPLGTITTTPECVQDYMIAWHARLGPILCPCAMVRPWGPCGAPHRHMTQDTSTGDEMRPAFARAWERPSWPRHSRAQPRWVNVHKFALHARAFVI